MVALSSNKPEIPMPDRVKAYLSNNFIGRTIDSFCVKEHLGSGNSAVTFGVEDTFGVRWALKLVTPESYGDSAKLKEVSRFSGINDERYLVFPKETGQVELDILGDKLNFYWFKSRQVNGTSLKDFIHKNESYSVRSELTRYISHIATALDTLHRYGFQHGDLHNKNIMREAVGTDGPIPEIKYVIIDFSDARAFESEKMTDLEYFANHLRYFYDQISLRENLSRDDKKVLKAISHIPGLYSGELKQGFRSPVELLKLYTSALSQVHSKQDKLASPFDPVSAEYIANDKLLTKLCYTGVSWYDDLKSKSTVVLTGPRGSGKSMIFRRNRLKTKIIANKRQEIANDDFAAFYLPCESLFFMRFSNLTARDLDEHMDALVTFFNIAVMHEVCSTLALLPENESFKTPDIASKIYRLMLLEIGTDFTESSNLPSMATSLVEIVDIAEYAMRYIRRTIAAGQKVSVKRSVTFIDELVSTVKNCIPILKNRFFVFMLDDFTDERVPIDLQKALHPIISPRSQEYCFKLSSHMFGSIYNTPEPPSQDIGRNIHVINLGTRYLSWEDKKKKSKMIETILDKRLAHAKGYAGKITDWLGTTSYPGGRSLAKALHDPETRSTTYYHGLQCLLQLCSGDYSEMIKLVGAIFDEAQVERNDKPKLISKGIQHKAIVRVSRDFLWRTQHTHVRGIDLHSVVDAFGQLSNSLLLHRMPVKQGTNSSGAERRDPYDLLTVYVDNLNLANKSSRETWQALQQASIFVDIGIAPSQRNVIADRATLRRIYCPAFMTSLSSSEHLQLTRDQFEYFMDEPYEFCRKRLEKTVVEITQRSFLEDDQFIRIEPRPPEEVAPENLPAQKDYLDFENDCDFKWIEICDNLPPINKLSNILQKKKAFDIYIGALGFEDRCISGIRILRDHSAKVKNAILLQYDQYLDENDRWLEEYSEIILKLTGGIPHRPLNAPIGQQDLGFTPRLMNLLQRLSKKRNTSIIFDLTSCPSLLVSKIFAILLKNGCDVTIIYSEAKEYFPSKDDWENGRVKPYGSAVRSPFEGVSFIDAPPILQSDDIGEHAVLLVLFPTFNTERTGRIISHIDPASRIWAFGVPHNLQLNGHHVEMRKKFAAPNIHPGDPWTLVPTFDYRSTLKSLVGIYRHNQKNGRLRICLMPHGSKFQTVAVGLFRSLFECSLVFAMPQKYNADGVSEGTLEVWGIRLSNTEKLLNQLRLHRITKED